MGVRLSLQGSIGGFEWELLLFSAGLLACCMFCHGELARMKPEPRQGLTFFYLMIATGEVYRSVGVRMENRGKGMELYESALAGSNGQGLPAK